MIPHRPPLPNHLHPPKIQPHTVQQSRTSDDGETPSGVEADIIAEIQEGGGDGAEDDAEFEPGEEGAFGGEVDFWFDADGDVDA